MFPRIVQIPLPFEVLGTDTLTIYSFGAMLAVAFLMAAWLTRLELDRLYTNGRLPSVRMRVPSGGKGKGKKPRMVDVSPSHLVGTMTVIAIAGGLVGAKVFHILENLGEFAANPFSMIFSTGGLTFYGGLIVAAASILWYMRKHRVPMALLSDAVLPTVLLAYGIGRIGCHLAATVTGGFLPIHPCGQIGFRDGYGARPTRRIFWDEHSLKQACTPHRCTNLAWRPCFLASFGCFASIRFGRDGCSLWR